MNDTFEERLLSALKEVTIRRLAEKGMAARTPVRRGPSRRALGLSAAVAGAAAAATVALTLFGGAGTPAYAVVKGADGSVEVQINAFRDSGELEAKLAEVGITAVVDYLPADQTCQEPRGEQATAGGRTQVGVGRDGKGITFTISKGQIGPDQTLVLAISTDQAGPDRPPVATSLRVVKRPVSTCVVTPLHLPANPPGNENKQDNGPTDNIERGGKDEGPGLSTTTS
ncbi:MULTISPECIES: hypothetical protein [Streptosporangium]|uniref:Uncharacterized protein n=1 Tax=Streptosporangium brasiliense TaxID=47480 RepID=A0ABT9R1V6_9ACTN|nr:hypothetical protein [Streptosporangium brasiliense]MDP9862822.1 hypothetical protein [Streptosporangium brasiliense]